jgi:hypothetical protein
VSTTRVAFFFGGPCNGQQRNITFDGDVPQRLTCRGTEYFWAAGARGLLNYYTAAELGRHDPKAEVRGQRDVFMAWHRLMTTLHKRVGGERQRIEGARQRIRRAVR